MRIIKDHLYSIKNQCNSKNATNSNTNTKVSPHSQVILVGDQRVGKTSFLTRYTKNIMLKNPETTIGVEYTSKSILLKNHDVIVKTQIWDTSGSEKYKSITTAHYRKAVGALLFYDLTDESTFKNCVEWMKDSISSWLIQI